MSLKDLGNPVINSIDQEVGVTASISGLPNESYFRVEWQKSSGDNYFGNVKINDSWIVVNSAQDCKNYLHIVDTNTSSLDLTTKIGDAKNLVNGDYNLKLRRFTASCASYSDSDPIPITLNLTTSNPTSVPSTPGPTQTKTAAQNPTKPPITSVPIVSTPKPTPEEQKAEDPIGLNEVSQVLDPQNVLGLTNSPTPTQPGIIPTPLPNLKNKALVIAFILVGLGIIFVSASIYMVWQTSKAQKILK